MGHLRARHHRPPRAERLRRLHVRRAL